MSEEEKQAIELVKEITYIRGIRQDVEGHEEDHWALDIVLNLIDKQQKEIEYLKGQIPQDKIFYYSEKEYISKDKIKEKIKELEKQQEENRKEFYNEINLLNFKKLDIISNRISINLAVREFLKELLEE